MSHLSSPEIGCPFIKQPYSAYFQAFQNEELNEGGGCCKEPPPHRLPGAPIFYSSPRGSFGYRRNADLAAAERQGSCIYFVIRCGLAAVAGFRGGGAGRIGR
jgi:hypothetical protein